MKNAARLDANVVASAWGVWLLISSLPWLLPTHADPWTTFYGETSMAAVMLIPAAWAIIRSSGSWNVDGLSLGFALAALVPLLQAIGGIYKFPAEAPLVSLYLLGIAVAVLVARRSEDETPGHFIDALFAGLVAASIASTGIALYQWLRLDATNGLILPLSKGDRPSANLGQPNNLSTLFLWGLVGLWWGYLRRNLGGVGAVIGAVFLLLGIGLTLSRTGTVGVMMLAFAALLGRQKLRTTGHRGVWIGLAIWFVVLNLALEPLSIALFGHSGRSLADPGTSHVRWLFYEMAFEALLRHPWMGYGWNQIVVASVGLSTEFPLHRTVSNAHNIILDLALWNGIPLAMCMVAATSLWFWRVSRKPRAAEQCLLLLALAVFGLHALLELPHMLAFFLLPAAVFAGTLTAGTQRALVAIPRWFVAAVTAALGAVLVIVFNEYGRIETDGLAARMRAAHIAGVPDDTNPHAIVLSALQDGLVTLRTEPVRGMSHAELEHFRAAVTRYPTHSGLFRYAEASALNAQNQDAIWALHALCDLHPVDVCRASADGWSQLAGSGYPELKGVTPPRP